MNSSPERGNTCSEGPKKCQDPCWRSRSAQKTSLCTVFPQWEWSDGPGKTEGQDAGEGPLVQTRDFREAANWAFGCMSVPPPHMFTAGAQYARWAEPLLFQGRQRSLWLRIESCQRECKNRPNGKDCESEGSHTRAPEVDRVTHRMDKVHHVLIGRSGATRNKVSVQWKWHDLDLQPSAFHKNGLFCRLCSLSRYIWCL